MRVTRSIIPNLFTLANLFCGFSAILACSQGAFDRAALLILSAAIFDMLDGVVARLTRSTSEFGVELDSLCDAVSFGVAPSVMLWFASFHLLSNWGMLLASLPALAGVLRLARFNVQLTSMEDKAYFRGMPIPAGALTIISYVVWWHLPALASTDPTIRTSQSSVGLWQMAMVTVATAGAMVSTIRYDNLPRPTPRAIRQRPIVFVVFLTGVVAAVVSQGTTIFPFMALYMVGGAIRHLIMARRLRDADDTLEEPDPDPFEL